MYYDIALFKIIVLKVQDVHTCTLLMQAHVMAESMSVKKAVSAKKAVSTIGK